MGQIDIQALRNLLSCIGNTITSPINYNKNGICTNALLVTSFNNKKELVNQYILEKGKQLTTSLKNLDYKDGYCCCENSLPIGTGKYVIEGGCFTFEGENVLDKKISISFTPNFSSLTPVLVSIFAFETTINEYYNTSVANSLILSLNSGNIITKDFIPLLSPLSGMPSTLTIILIDNFGNYSDPFTLNTVCS